MLLLEHAIGAWLLIQIFKFIGRSPLLQDSQSHPFVCLSAHMSHLFMRNMVVIFQYFHWKWEWSKENKSGGAL